MIQKILIVEDDPRTRKTIEHFCKEVPSGENAEVMQASNGLEALDILQNNQPDIMFLDMEMAGMNGKELLEQLMEEDIHVEAVIVSGYDGFEYTRKAIQYGTMDYLLKPINRKQVHDLLEQLDKRVEENRKQIYVSKRTGGRIADVKMYIEEHYQEAITLSLLAEKFHYSREYISREFKKIYGIGVIRYLNEIRPERARVFLNKGISVQETCEMIGFLDDSYFAKIFKEKYGITPKQYQK